MMGMYQHVQSDRLSGIWYDALGHPRVLRIVRIGLFMSHTVPRC